MELIANVPAIGYCVAFWRLNLLSHRQFMGGYPLHSQTDGAI